MASPSLSVRDIAPEDQNVLSSELELGERLLWAGHPRRGLRLAITDVFVIPFSLLWCGFAIFWERTALKSGAPPFFALWGIPFVAVGLYIVFGRFVADALRRGKTTYGLTARRIIIVSGVLSRQVKSIDLDRLGEITLRSRGDHSGTVLLGTASGPNAFAVSLMGPSWPGAGRYLPPMLEWIDDARTVYEMIRNAKSLLR